MGYGKQPMGKTSNKLRPNNNKAEAQTFFRYGLLSPVVAMVLVIREKILLIAQPIVRRLHHPQLCGHYDAGEDSINCPADCPSTVALVI